MQSSQKAATAAGNIMRMPMIAQDLQSQWQSMLTQQGSKVPVEELLEEGVFGNVSNTTSRRTSPMGSAMQASFCPGQEASLIVCHGRQHKAMFSHGMLALFTFYRTPQWRTCCADRPACCANTYMRSLSNYCDCSLTAGMQQS